MVVTDCDNEAMSKITKCKLTNVFGKPPKDIRNGMAQFVCNIKNWLNENTIAKNNNNNNNNNNSSGWWNKIKHTGLALPYQCVRTFNLNGKYKQYMQQRSWLSHFEKLLSDGFEELRSDMNQLNYKHKNNSRQFEMAIKCLYDEKQANFSFSKQWQQYTRNNDQKIVNTVLQSKVSLLLQIFMKFCIFDNHSVKHNSWLNSEYLFILNEQCNLHNQECVYKLETYIDEEKIDIENSDIMLDKLSECEIRSYDFISNCDALFKFAQHGFYFNLSHQTQQNVELFIDCYKLFCKKLFEQGTPVTFTDSLNNDINDEFIFGVFGGLNTRNNNTRKGSIPSNRNMRNNRYRSILSVAIAGPQSTGKSTLLRRLFGIDARVSAGKTTKGINCSRVGLGNKDLMLVDTEGINSIESSMMKGKNSMENRKRNNKIMLGALASSNVFLLNIMKDPSDAKLLDVILWAYEKLDLKDVNMKNNGKNNHHSKVKLLSDIKFIFVIRDVQEYTDSKWLELQKRKVNQYLNDSIKLSPKYIENEFNGIETIEDLIGEPEYFAMPNAFDSNDAPNPKFSQRCVELRAKILNHFATNTSISGYDGYNYEYKNALQWSQNMIGIWRSIVRLETILCVADFRDQSMIKLLRTQVKKCLNQLRDSIRDKVPSITRECLEAHKKHFERCNKFETKITDLVIYERDKLLKCFDNNDLFKTMEINQSTIDNYKQEFRNQASIVILERKKQFHYKSRSKEALEIENDITRLLNNLTKTLRNAQIKDDSVISKRYWDTIAQKKKDFEKEHSKKEVLNQITQRFEKTYKAQVLQPNIRQGRSPGSLNALKTTQKPLKYVNINNTNNTTYYENDYGTESDKLRKEIKNEIGKLVNDYIISPLSSISSSSTTNSKVMKLLTGINGIGTVTTTMNENKHNDSASESASDIDINFSINDSWDDAHAWCFPFSILDGWMTNWDRKNFLKFAITEEFRCEAHGILKEHITSKLVNIHLNIINTDLARIDTIAHKKYDWFNKRVKTIQKDTEIGENIAKSIKSAIQVFCKEKIDSFIYNTIENNTKHYESSIFLQNAFEDAFNKKTGNATKAMNFIDNQALMMENAYKDEMDQIKIDLLNRKQFKLKNNTLLEYERIRVNNIIKSLNKRLDKVNTSILAIDKNKINSNINNKNNTKDEIKDESKDENKEKSDNVTTDQIYKYLQGNPIHFPNDWDYSEINNCETFVRALKEEINKFESNNLLSDIFFKRNFNVSFLRTEKYFHNKLLGCMKFCPFCNAKCQCEYNHVGRCKTNNHFLLAFSGKYSKKNNKLRINVCCSQSNMNRKWVGDNFWNSCVEFVYQFDLFKNVSKYYSELVTWDEKVKLTDESWYPINASNFKKKNVKLMLDCFFDKGLQDKLLEKYNTADPTLKRTLDPATRDDIEFKQEM